MVMKGNNELRRGDASSQQNFTESRNVKKVTESDLILQASETGFITELQRDLNFTSEMEIWLSAIDENIAGGDTLTVKFYKFLNDEYYLAETTTASSPAVTAGQAQRVEVLTTDAEIDSYDAYAISGTVTLVAGGSCDLLVGKKSQG